MFGHRVVSGCWLVLVSAAALALADEKSPPQAEAASAAPLEFQETIVAGAPEAFMEVRHIILRGSNFEIGKKLAQIGAARHRTGPFPSPDRRRTRAQLRYFEKNYPIHVERMRGVAATVSGKVEVDAWNFSGLYYGFRLPGCSAVFYPPATTAEGRGVLSRNFDFTTGMFDGTKPGPGELPITARPYVLEMHPNEGYASLVTCLFDLLSGVVDGINSEGLTVALLSDNETIQRYEVDRTFTPQPGFNEIQIARYLLDTCANVEEAKDALLGAKLYYAMAPNHYIIADRHGNAFVWENSPVMHRGHIIEGGKSPLVTTNFMLHLHPDKDKLPEEEYAFGIFNRYKTIQQRLAGQEGLFTSDFIKEANRCVARTDRHPEEAVPARTLWHALYYPAERRAEIDFYLGDDDDPAAPGGFRIRRSGYQTFTLGP